MNAVHTVTLNQATIKGLNISWKSQLLEHDECSLVWHKVGQQGSTAPSLNLHVVPFELQRSLTVYRPFTDRLLRLCVMLQPFAKIKASKYSPINSHSMPKDDNMRTDFQNSGTRYSPESSWARGHEPSQQNLGTFWCSSRQTLSNSAQFDGGCWGTFSGLAGGKGSGQRSGWLNQGLPQSCAWDSRCMDEGAGQPRLRVSWLWNRVSRGALLRSADLPAEKHPTWGCRHGAARVVPNRWWTNIPEMIKRRGKKPEIKCEGLLTISCCHELVNN